MINAKGLFLGLLLQRFVSYLVSRAHIAMWIAPNKGNNDNDNNSRVDYHDESSHFLNYQDGSQRRWLAGGPYLLFYIPQFVEINTSTVSARLKMANGELCH